MDLNEYLQKEGHFAFGAVIEKAEEGDNGEMFVTAVASDTKVDYHGDRMSTQAVRRMSAQAKKGLPILDNHRSTFEFGRTVDGRAVKVGESTQLVIKIKLDPEFPQSKKLFEEVKAGKCDRQMSIGGMINFDNPNAVEFAEEDGNWVRIINDIILEHIAATRKDMAANGRAGFLDAVSKALDEMKVDKSFFRGLMFKTKLVEEKAELEGTPSASVENNSDKTLESASAISREYDDQEPEGSDMTDKATEVADEIKTAEEVAEVENATTEENTPETTEASAEVENNAEDNTEEKSSEEVAETEEVKAEESSEEVTEEKTEEAEEVSEEATEKEGPLASLVNRLGDMVNALAGMTEEKTEEVDEVSEEEATEEETSEEEKSTAAEDLKKAAEGLTEDEAKNLDTDVLNSIARILSFYSPAEKEAAHKDFVLKTLGGSDVAARLNESLKVTKELAEVVTTDIVETLKSSTEDVSALKEELEAKDEVIKSLSERLEALEKSAGISHKLEEEGDEEVEEKDKGIFSGMFDRARNQIGR